MNNELIKDFQTRIVNAGRGELLIINYEMLLAEIEGAVEALNHKNEPAFEKAMIQSHKLLRELSSSLDFKYSISKELMSIYIYLNKKLVDASMKHESSALEESVRIINILLSGWKLVEVETDETPVIANGQKVYAGLTYGRSSLNESVDHAASRGFRA